MKCPKCGYISFDHNDTCPKCRKDISAARAQLNLPDFEVVIPVLTAGAAVGGKLPAGVRAHVPGFGATLETDFAGTGQAEQEKEGILEDEMEGFTFDLEDLALTPDDSEAPPEQPTLNKAGIPKEETTDFQIDLAIEDLEVEDLLPDEQPESVRTPGASREPAPERQPTSDNHEIAMDLEDLELDLDLDGKK